MTQGDTTLSHHLAEWICHESTHLMLQVEDLLKVLRVCYFLVVELRLLAHYYVDALTLQELDSGVRQTTSTFPYGRYLIVHQRASTGAGDYLEPRVKIGGTTLFAVARAS